MRDELNFSKGSLHSEAAFFIGWKNIDVEAERFTQ